MPTQPAPSKTGNLDIFATAVRDVATYYDDMVRTDKAGPNELAKTLKRLKLLIALCEHEVRQLRSKK